MAKLWHVITGAVLSASLFSGPVLAASSEGYEPTNRPAVEREDGKLEVKEYFWYGCPHCYTFEPTIEDWIKNKPDDVAFEREAPPFNPSWAPHSKAYYAAKIMKVEDKLHKPLFDAIHKDKKPLYTEEAIAEFAGTLGIDEKKFLKVMKSPSVKARLEKAKKEGIRYGLMAVPTIVVNGKYRTGGSLAGSNQRAMEIVDSLLEMERANQ